MAETIHFILTGGTIDSFYDGTKDTVVPNRHSAVLDFIRNLNLRDKTKFTEICMKDSRELTMADRKRILNAIEKSAHKRIIVTHGTYTMQDTARYLKENLKRTDQTIIFTGSIMPLVGFTHSDAPFNLGYSIAKVTDLKPGVYVCMNGSVFSPAESIKLARKGMFVSVFGDKAR